MKQNSELKIIFSNCLIGGSAWNNNIPEVISVIRQALYETSGIEFRAINTNNSGGEHTSTTIIITGAFYNLKENVEKTDMLNMEQIMTSIIQKIPEFTCAEVRIEHTRHRSTFTESHPRLT